MSIKGSHYANFRRALATDNLMLIRSAAVELPRISLDDALRVCLTVSRVEPETYEKAALRWLGRFCLERPGLTLAQVRRAAAALERLPEAPEEASAELDALCRRAA